MGLVVDVAAGILRGAGHKDLADWIKNAPAKAGEEIGKILQGGLKSDGTMTPGALSELEALQKANPQVAPPPPDDLLTEYATDLNALIAMASSAKKAVALKGFFHAKDCLTLWVFVTEPRAPFARFDNTDGDDRIWVYNSGIDIYIGPAVDDAELERLNLALEKDPAAVIKELEERCDSKVRFITKNAVSLSPLRGRSRADKIAEIENPENIAEAFRTMRIALDAQSSRLRGYRESSGKWREASK
ncbi:MAG: hypothetical protein AB7O65_05875 [Candidatus Korobacteraceae bacterium]